MTGEPWVAAHTARAPAALRERVHRYLAEVPPATPLPERLAVAARRALEAVLARGDDRGAALDLLAADGLVTLALLARAEESPGALADFAAGLVRAGIA